MARKPSEHVCGRCGLAVYAWGVEGWKHAASGTTSSSCGRTPQVVTRAAYKEQAAAEVAALAHALRNLGGSGGR
ncbi:hypothetical protein AB0395_34945 [Streptosporangium sp. NPDC051023]|uniref:hypothetical protein n=1 Tax=Streptosporangium sp. NPDC051023 TaxID=3155410 RepID=UPI00344FD2E1